MINRITTFVKEARIEIKKVVWPTKHETMRHTLAVILISLGVAGFLGALDLLFTFVLNNFVL